MSVLFGVLSRCVSAGNMSCDGQAARVTLVAGSLLRLPPSPSAKTLLVCQIPRLSFPLCLRSAI